MKEYNRNQLVPVLDTAAITNAIPVGIEQTLKEKEVIFMKKTNLKHAAISPRVPGSFTGRKVSTLLEEAALIRANQLKQKEKEVVLMKAEKKEIEVKDINAAAFVKHKVVSPTISMKGDTINFVCPDNYSTKLCLEVYKANPSIAMAESVDALRMLKAQIAAMRKSDHQEKDANGEE